MAKKSENSSPFNLIAGLIALCLIAAAGLTYFQSSGTNSTAPELAALSQAFPMQAAEAIKLLSGNADAINRQLTIIDLWDNRIRQVKLDGLRGGHECPACNKHELPWLDGDRGSHSAILCGRNAVQLSQPERSSISLEALESQLPGIGEVTPNAYLLRLDIDQNSITVFPDGRASVVGTEDIAEANTLCAKYIGA